MASGAVDQAAANLLRRLDAFPRARLACLPTPVHPLERLSADLGGPEIWIKRDDLTGLPGGGNKTRKLEFLLADALRAGASTLVTVGAVQSNHTRQTAAAAARVGLHCALLHNNWVRPAPGPAYEAVGNVLFSDLLGATLYYDSTEREIGDEGRLEDLVTDLRARGEQPYLIPGGASEHRLGGLGYALCAAELARQSRRLGLEFDAVVHCTGSSSTQAGLLAGFAALGSPTRVIGIADDHETAEKRERVLRLARATLAELGLGSRIAEDEVDVIAVDKSPYGVADADTIAAMQRVARTEGLIADPVYEGKAVRGLIELVRDGVLGRGSRVLLLHLGGTPAVHAYADRLRGNSFVPVPAATVS